MRANTENWRHYLVHEGPFRDGPKSRYPYDWTPVHGGAIALILKCAGDGRHWVNTTGAPARAHREAEAGLQVLGLVREPDREAAVKALGTYPHQGDTACERCAEKEPRQGG